MAQDVSASRDTKSMTERREIPGTLLVRVVSLSTQSLLGLASLTWFVRGGSWHSNDFVRIQLSDLPPKNRTGANDQNGVATNQEQTTER